jgi:hypothetical protein
VDRHVHGLDVRLCHALGTQRLEQPAGRRVRLLERLPHGTGGRLDAQGDPQDVGRAGCRTDAVDLHRGGSRRLRRFRTDDVRPGEEDEGRDDTDDRNDGEESASGALNGHGDLRRPGRLLEDATPAGQVPSGDHDSVAIPRRRIRSRGARTRG